MEVFVEHSSKISLLVILCPSHHITSTLHSRKPRVGRFTCLVASLTFTPRTMASSQSITTRTSLRAKPQKESWIPPSLHLCMDHYSQTIIIIIPLLLKRAEKATLPSSSTSSSAQSILPNSPILPLSHTLSPYCMASSLPQIRPVEFLSAVNHMGKTKKIWGAAINMIFSFFGNECLARLI